MKKPLLIGMFAMLLGAQSIVAQTQDCEIPISIVLAEQTDPLPEVAESQLHNALERMVLSRGIVSDVTYTQFILTPRIHILSKDVLPGPPTMHSTTFGITLYVADLINKSKYASAYFELKGVGTNENKAYIDAFKRLNGQSKSVNGFIEKSKRKILQYYDENYQNIIAEAKRKADLQHYEEAIAMVVAIPTCSAGGDVAIREGLKIYEKYRDKYNLKLLNKARSIWGANQQGEAIQEAAQILAQIDPEAACYADAVKLSQEIKKRVGDDVKFEMREKYHDKVDITKQSINAMREVGVAFGKGQQPQTTNIAWIK